MTPGSPDLKFGTDEIASSDYVSGLLWTPSSGTHMAGFKEQSQAFSITNVTVMRPFSTLSSSLY